MKARSAFAVVQTNHMLGFGKEEPARHGHTRQMGENGDQRPEMAKGQQEQQNRQHHHQPKRDQAQLLCVLAADLMNHLAHEVVGACMRWLKRAHRADAAQPCGAGHIGA